MAHVREQLRQAEAARDEAEVRASVLQQQLALAEAAGASEGMARGYIRQGAAARDEAQLRAHVLQQRLVLAEAPGAPAAGAPAERRLQFERQAPETLLEPKRQQTMASAEAAGASGTAGLEHVRQAGPPLPEAVAASGRAGSGRVRLAAAARDEAAGAARPAAAVIPRSRMAERSNAGASGSAGAAQRATQPASKQEAASAVHASAYLGHRGPAKLSGPCEAAHGGADEPQGDPGRRKASSQTLDCPGAGAAVPEPAQCARAQEPSREPSAAALRHGAGAGVRAPQQQLRPDQEHNPKPTPSPKPDQARRLESPLRAPRCAAPTLGSLQALVAGTEAMVAQTLTLEGFGSNRRTPRGATPRGASSRAAAVADSEATVSPAFAVEGFGSGRRTPSDGNPGVAKFGAAAQLSPASVSASLARDAAGGVSKADGGRLHTPEAGGHEADHARGNAEFVGAEVANPAAKPLHAAATPVRALSGRAAGVELKQGATKRDNLSPAGWGAPARSPLAEVPVPSARQLLPAGGACFSPSGKHKGRTWGPPRHNEWTP